MLFLFLWLCYMVSLSNTYNEYTKRCQFYDIPYMNQYHVDLAKLNFFPAKFILHSNSYWHVQYYKIIKNNYVNLFFSLISWYWITWLVKLTSLGTFSLFYFFLLFSNRFWKISDILNRNRIRFYIRKCRFIINWNNNLLENNGFHRE